MFLSSYLQLTYVYLISEIFWQTVASPTRAPTCYPDDGQYPPPRYADCVRATAVLRNSPFFSRPQTFGAFENPPRRVPLEWHYKTCLVSIDVDDGSRRDTFALSATMPAFAALEETCIKRRKPGQGFGGFVPVGNGRGFFAIVQFDPDYQSAPALSRPWSNDTQASQGAGVTETA